MSTDLKFRLLLAFAMACLVAITIQGILLWRMHEQLAALGPEQGADATLEERILSQLDEPTRPLAGTAPFPAFPADPFTSIQQLQDRFDSLFGTSGFGGLASQPGFALDSPKIELNETPSAFEVLVRAPKDKTLELTTSIEGTTLSLHGTLESSAKQNQNNFSSSVFSQSQFSRTIRLPAPVDEFGLSTHTTDEGIIVTLPKKTP